MKLTQYRLHGVTPQIRPAPAQRQWMDDTPNAYAYRCLPLNIANMHGWELLCPVDFSVEWDGSNSRDGLAIRTEAAPHLRPVSHFGSGIVTLHVGAVFRTEPGYNLYVGGPANATKDGIYPLTGVIETDWAPYSFTMNWKLTRAGDPVRFEKDEPFCCVFPVSRNLLEQIEPEIRDIADDPQLAHNHHVWTQSRLVFNTGLKVEGSEAQKDKWLKVYYRGLQPDGASGVQDHRTKLHLREFSWPPTTHGG